MRKDRLLDSKFDDGETINGLLEEFEAKVKPNFENAGRKYSIKIPGVKASIKDLGILNGCLKLAGEHLADCFRFSVENAIESVTDVRDQIEGCSGDMPVWLVGGFGASPWLFKQLKDRLGPEGFAVCKPDSNQAKVVADGAVRFYLHRSVAARLSPSCYGISCGTPYNPDLTEHRKRKRLVYTLLIGGQHIPTFSCIANKVEC